jgi:L-asparagine transporter-like permease
MFENYNIINYLILMAVWVIIIAAGGFTVMYAWLVITNIKSIVRRRKYEKQRCVNDMMMKDRYNG